MPYVAMSQVKWCDSKTRKIHTVNAGDEVCEPVPSNVIARGLVAYLEHVPGMMWDERVAESGTASELPAVPVVSDAALSEALLTEDPLLQEQPTQQETEKPQKRKRGRPRKNR